MKMPILFPVLLVLLTGISTRLVLTASRAVEICDNGIDDDNDGLIDLNDPECACAPAVPESLINNPSFEERNCCPTDRSQLHCAKGWIQASDATTDFMHTCGMTSRPEFMVPKPIPDGNGWVGWRNGNVGNPNFKEYSGACLKGPLKAGTSYRFEFWVGFTYAVNSPPTNITFFGTTDCKYLPFGSGDTRFGCPTNGPGWVLLGSVPISGKEEWKLYEITVTPSSSINAIAIGPDCTPITASANSYYYFDNLVLAAQDEFVFNIQQSGNPCSSAMTLEVLHRDTLNYQWYMDGVALKGQTNSKLTGALADGKYQVRISSKRGCQVTNPFFFQKPVYSGKQPVSICYGESYYFSGRQLRQSGIYYDTLKTKLQCDSIAELSLKVLDPIIDTVKALIYEGESFEVGTHSYSSPGTYESVLKSAAGCDSLVVLHLNYFRFYFPNIFSPNHDGINDIFTIYAPQGVTEIAQLQVFDRWGGIVFQGKNLSPYAGEAGWNGTLNDKPAPAGLYVYKAIIKFHDGQSKIITGSMTLIR
jgi:gliding motility-associated-like protein